MTEKPVRFRNILPVGDDIMEDYLDNDLNMSEISKKYGLHYSNVRRFIKHRIKEMGIEETFNVQHINVEDFPYLDVGDTFQFAEWLTIFSIEKITRKDGDDVFEMVPVGSKNPVRHWICDERQE